MIDFSKNREREKNYEFANINLLGKCNVDCYFCLGKDIDDLLSLHNQTGVHTNPQAVTLDSPADTDGPGGGNGDWSPIWPTPPS